VQLRDARFVDAELGADVLHRHFVVVVERDHALLARRQRGDGVADAVLHLVALVLHVGALRLRGHEHRGQLRLVDVLRAREGRGRFDRVDAHDRLPQALLVGADRLGEIGERRLVSERRAQLLARGFELATHAAHAARPGILAERVDHRAADAPLGEGLELDAARIVEAVRGVDQPDHAVLHEIAEVD